MAEYLAAINRGSNTYGLNNSLLRRTASGTYLLKVYTEKKPGKFLHLAERLGDMEEPIEKLEERLLEIPGWNKQARTGTYVIEPLRTKLGCKLGRIARPVQGWGSAVAYQDTEIFVNAYYDRLRHVSYIYENLIDFCRSIELSRSNLWVYVNATRNLLITACFEVEALFKILVFEDFQSNRGNMPSYWRASKPAKLSDYRLRFTEMPYIDPVRPFDSWAPGSTSYTPLDWYNAYNDIKHNSVQGSAAASLWSVLNAIAACFILISAIQKPSPNQTMPTKRVMDSFDQSFDLESQPNWSAGENYWMLPAKPLQFTDASNALGYG